MADEIFKDEALNDDDLDKVTGGANPTRWLVNGTAVEIVKPLTEDPKGRNRVDIPSINKNKYKE